MARDTGDASVKSFSTPVVSLDGMSVSVPIMATDGSETALTFRSPDAYKLIVALQAANRTALLRFSQGHASGSSVAVPIDAIVPRSIELQPNLMTGDLILLIDRSHPSEVAIQLTPQQAKQLGIALSGTPSATTLTTRPQ